MEIGCALGGLLWHVRFLRESFRIICGVYARPRNIELKSHRSQEIMAMIPPFESRRVRIGETSLRVVQRGPAPQLGLELSAVPPALMVNILFWNVNCRPLEHLLAAAVKLHGCRPANTCREQDADVVCSASAEPGTARLQNPPLEHLHKDHGFYAIPYQFLGAIRGE